MPQRKYYPAPQCPKCGKQGAQCSRVVNTEYTRENEIIRHRECLHCGWRWWTRQQVETSIDPAKERVFIPNFKDTPRGRQRFLSILPADNPL